ncbi:MAG: hypothetical protein Unbinned8472contig1000_88 [Prokaryotic dsDNA virus sp.]|nr:MAG: hypothetical protein Unbinned8472contig1000_88 [Prokaryotic dsDNA virus sp.]
MEALLFSFVSEYGPSAAIIVLGILVSLMYKKIVKLEAKVEEGSKMYATRKEVKEQIVQEIKVVEKDISYIYDAIKRVEEGTEKVTNAISDLRTDLLHQRLYFQKKD